MDFNLKACYLFSFYVNTYMDCLGFVMALCCVVQMLRWKLESLYWLTLEDCQGKMVHLGLPKHKRCLMWSLSLLLLADMFPALYSMVLPWGLNTFCWL